MKIVFIGSGDFSVPILEFLNKNSEVVLCISRPDRRSGRGKKVVRSVIGLAADNLGIEMFTPETINSVEAIEKIREYNFDVAILASYSEILSPEIIKTLKNKIINIHPSLLPKYRGAEPIRWAIRKGETETGVSLMLITEKLDRGQILAHQSILISDSDNNETLQEKLINLSKEMLPETMEQVKNGYKGIEQAQEKLFYARRLNKKDELIDWSKSAEIVSRKIRSMSPKPGCYSIIHDTRVKLFDPKIIEDNKGSYVSGQIISINKKIIVACGENLLSFSKVQREGKRIMDTKDFAVSGFVKENDIFKNQLTL